MARRKPQRYQDVSRGFATTPWGRRRALMYRYFRVAALRTSGSLAATEVSAVELSLLARLSTIYHEGIHLHTPTAARQRVPSPRHSGSGRPRPAKSYNYQQGLRCVCSVPINLNDLSNIYALAPTGVRCRLLPLTPEAASALAEVSVGMCKTCPWVFVNAQA